MDADQAATVEKLRAIIVDESGPIAKRIHTVFELRTIGGPVAVEALAAGLSSPSVLLSHEIAYILGQMQDRSAVPYLEATLANLSLDPITRHEAAEALAALGSEDALPFLEKFLDDEHEEVRDTVIISCDRIKWRRDNPELAATEKGASNHHSVDPAPGHTPELQNKTPDELAEVLCDTSLSLFERYTAMFALRNKGDEESVLALAKGFADKSAVFRHEVAYVMGQLQHPAAVESLKKVLEDDNEHAMVRHEAAEALGEIDDERCLPLVEKFQHCEDKIVKESCDVALGIAEYWKEFDAAGEVQEDA